MLREENRVAEKLRPHIGHNVVCVYYGDPDDPADICIECETCGEALVSAEDFNNGEKYHAAAKIMEELQDPISKPAELKYLQDFVRGGDFNVDLYRDQLRCLWTAYCFHHNLIVDTGKYDSTVLGLWDLMQDDQQLWKDFDEFDNFLCKYLI